MLLRIRKRRTVGEPNNRCHFLQVEFVDEYGRPDLQLSVYAVRREEAVRAHTEHYAGNNLGPAGQDDLDLTNLHRNTRTSPGRTGFLFTERAHRELLFKSDAELEDLVARLLGDLPKRSVRVEKASMREYVFARIRENDVEWLRFYRGNPRSEWRRWMDRARAEQQL